MVIERALEKMRQAGAAKAAQAKATTRTVPPPGGVERRKPTLQSDAPQTPKPEFPAVRVDVAMAQTNRILLPHSAPSGTDDARPHAAYRMLRTRLLQKLRTSGWSTLAITSPGAGEGKSVTALNLALSIARERSSEVFLIDLDMRNPSTCNYLGLRPPRELVGYFAGEGKPEDVFFSIGVSHLTLAGGTVSTDQASELLANGRLEDLLAYIRGITADPLILIDLPPLLVTDEALLVAPRVDATALVVSEGRTRRDSLVRARQLLADFTFAGVILNRSSESYGADSYYGYGYNYRYGGGA